MYNHIIMAWHYMLPSSIVLFFIISQSCTFAMLFLNANGNWNWNSRKRCLISTPCNTKTLNFIKYSQHPFILQPQGIIFGKFVNSFSLSKSHQRTYLHMYICRNVVKRVFLVYQVWCDCV